MHKNSIANSRIRRRDFVCYVIFAFTIAASGGVYMYKNFSSIREYFTEKNEAVSGVSHLSIPLFTVCGTIYKNDDIATSMSKTPSPWVQQLSKTTKIPLNRILIENFGDYDAKNAYLDIIIDKSCIEYLQKFISDNNIDFKFFISSAKRENDKDNYFTNYEINYASLGNTHNVKNTFKTKFISTIHNSGNAEIAIPHDLYFFIRLVAHLNFFIKKHLLLINSLTCQYKS